MNVAGGLGGCAPQPPEASFIIHFELELRLKLVPKHVETSQKSRLSGFFVRTAPNSGFTEQEKSTFAAWISTTFP